MRELIAMRYYQRFLDDVTAYEERTLRAAKESTGG